MISNLHYWLGAVLFKTGLAGLHPWLHEKIMRQLQRAAEKQHSDALLLFGQLLRYKGMTPYNKIAGVGYLRQAVISDYFLGQADALFLLAEALCDPDLLVAKQPQDNVVDYYEKAANQGHLMSALRLSKIYHNGLYDQAKDELKAQYWREKFMSASGLDK